MKIKEFYIKRCIQLAKNGLGTTYPNPLVGSVIVHNNKIIGEGWHQRAGEPHAEVHAVNSVKNRSLLKESTIYVNLEPCSHHGKTPPCSDLIIREGIPNVVIGTIDPFSEVAGRGVKKLIEAGHHVTVGILEDECRELNKRFFTFHNKKRPYIILKWAESSDGFLSPAIKDTSRPVWITNDRSRQLVHKWRSEEQAILVGTNTVLADNPKLDVRSWYGKSPVRVVIDRQLKTPSEFAVWDDSIRTIIFSESEINTGVYKNTSCIKIDFSKDLPSQILTHLYENNIQSLIIEGGLMTLETFISAGIWDEARVFKGQVAFDNGTPAPVMTKKIYRSEKIAGDTLIFYKNL